MNKEFCFLSLIDNYIMSCSNFSVWSDYGNQALMNAIKYNTTSSLGLPNRDLWVKLQQWLKTEKQIQITLYYLCPIYHKQDVNCYRKLKKWLISTWKTFWKVIFAALWEAYVVINPCIIIVGLKSLMKHLNLWSWSLTVFNIWPWLFRGQMTLSTG